MLWFPVGANAKISTAQSKFGSSSFHANGFSFCYSAQVFQFMPGTGDFTVEFWYRPTSFAQWRSLFSINDGWLSTAANDGLAILLGTAGSNQLRFWMNGAERTPASANPFTIGTWSHVALTRASGAVTLWVDGASKITATVATNIDVRSMSFGGADDYYSAVGHLDEIRITEGVARYTSAFTPPSAAFTLAGDPYEANVVALLHFEGADGSTTFTDEVASKTLPGASKILDETVRLHKNLDFDAYMGTIRAPVEPDNVNTRALNTHLGKTLTNFKTEFDTALNPEYISGFIEGETIKNAAPLGDVRVNLSTTHDAVSFASTITQADGKYIFHHLAPYNELYEIRATPKNAEPHNSIIYRKMTATPYQITNVSGKFTQNSSTGTVDSTVVIESGLGPFTATLVEGTLPPSTSVSVSGRNINIVGTTTFTGNYTFLLSIEGAPGYSPARVFEFELTPPNVFPLGRCNMFDGSSVKNSLIETASYWRVYIQSVYSGSVTSMVELEFDETQATGGTAFASSEYSGAWTAGNAFNGIKTGDTGWASLGVPPAHIGYNFGTPKAFNSISITSRTASPSQSPTLGVVQTSQDGTTWKDAWVFSNANDWGANETRTFTRPEALT